MFDKMTFHAAPRTVDVRVTEKRAPTDESVRLLAEMEKAARDKMLASVRLEDNGFECVVHKWYEATSGEHRLAVQLSLCGRRHLVQYAVRHGSTEQQVAEGVRDAVAKEIANQIGSAFTKVL